MQLGSLVQALGEQAQSGKWTLLLMGCPGCCAGRMGKWLSTDGAQHAHMP